MNKMSSLLPIEERYKSIFQEQKPDYAASEICRLIDIVAELGKENEKLKKKLATSERKNKKYIRMLDKMILGGFKG